MKKILIAILATITFIVAFFGILGFNNNITIAVNHIILENSQACLIENTTFVPLRSVFEKMGFDVEWNAADRNAILSNSEYKLVISPDDDFYYVNDNKITPQKPQIMIEDKLYLPLRSIAEAVGCTVEWDQKNHRVDIYYSDDAIDIDNQIDFAYNLNKCMPKNKNYVFSPLSIKLAFAMAANGAYGETKNEILNSLGINNIEEYNQYVQELIAYYNKDESNEYRQDLVFNIANSVWLNSSVVDFSQQFKNNVSQYYDAEIATVNNSNAVEKINSWVDDKTHGLIKDIIDSPDFVGLLANACYFKANWQNEFEKSDTMQDTFTYRNGDTQQIDFMNITDNFKYYSDENVQMVSMPYSGSKNISMYISLSDDRNIDYNQYFDRCKSEYVHISLPKFKIEFDTSLNDILKLIGINKAFNSFDAEFQPMFDNNQDIDFYIDQALHKAYINVDEEGTEAAAVTALIMEATGVMEPEKPIPVEFVADKPFTYIVRDNDNGEILFIGEFACK